MRFNCQQIGYSQAQKKDQATIWGWSKRFGQVFSVSNNVWLCFLIVAHNAIKDKYF